MLKIRLSRTGRKNQPYFRVVVTRDSAPPKSGYLAVIGHYDPKNKKIVINKEAATSWMAKGAWPSEKVAVLMKKVGLSNKKIEELAEARKLKMKRRMEEKIKESPVKSEGETKVEEIKNNEVIVKETATENQ